MRDFTKSANSIMFNEYRSSVSASSAIRGSHYDRNTFRNIFHEITKRKSNVAACYLMKLRKKSFNELND